LITVGGAANGAAEEHQPAVILTGAEDLSRMPRERRAVKRDEHQSGVSARYQKGRIVEAKPSPVLPAGDVDDGKLFHESAAR